MIILDLEWNNGCGEERFNEILQIGAVRINRLGGKIVNTFCVYIKPFVQKEFSPPAQDLPDLQFSIDSLVDLSSGISSFFQWCGDEVEFASWGFADFGILAENIGYCKLNYTLPDNLFDLQAAFGSLLGTEARIALYKAVEYCNIPAIFSFHNALNDSVYTALIGNHLKTDQLIIIPQKRRENRSKNTAWPRKKKRRCGPFLSLENVLNSRACRHAACPLCGKTIGISNWFFANSQHYYSKFSCPDHGKFIYHLEPLLDQKSNWWGSLSVLEACTENMAAYRSVRGTKRFRCKQSNHSRKRRRAYLYI